MVLNPHWDPAQHWRPPAQQTQHAAARFDGSSPSPQKRTRPEMKEREQNLLLQHGGGSAAPWGDGKEGTGRRQSSPGKVMKA